MFPNQQQKKSLSEAYTERRGERGAALVMVAIIMVLLAGIAMCVIAAVSDETRIAGSDMRRTQTFYAAAAGIEKMTNDFSGLFTRTSNPSQAQLDAIELGSPPELVAEGFRFNQTLELDQALLTKMQLSQGITNGSNPTVTIPSGPFAGLLASVSPYKLNSTATQVSSNIEVTLKREINNYLIPLFQFGMFSDGDIELHPGPPFVFNGRVHANGNLYLNGDVTLRDKVTVANELVFNVLRNNSTRTGANVRMVVNGITVPLTMGSVVNGPNFPTATQGQRGFFPGSPNGSDNTSWKSTSVAPAQAGQNNKFGGQLLTRMTGASSLLLPLQLGGNPTRELIKRQVTGDATADPVLHQSRYHTKAQIRILIDDESVTSDAAGIRDTDCDGGTCVKLSTFNPIALDGGKALLPVSDTGAYTSTTNWIQGKPGTGQKMAQTVRGVRFYNVPALGTTAPDKFYAKTTDPAYVSLPKVNGVLVPPGSGITGKILIQIVAPDGTARDVTKEILSMGVTVGEPNAIIHLQRPLWAAYMQGARDRDGGNKNLEFLIHDATSRCVADGEINIGTGFSINANSGHYDTTTPNNIDDDTHSASAPYMPISATSFIRNDRFDLGSMNSIVPINVYNPREGWIRGSLDATKHYERGMTSVVEVNMRNLARWVDGVFDANLLNNTDARSTYIDGAEGYVLYISDRRGDRLKMEYNRAGSVVQMTNGMVDNEDIYGPNSQLDPGEDVIDFGTDYATGQPKKGRLQRDTLELPDPEAGGWKISGIAPTPNQILSWMNPNNYFRRAVRLFNGDNLQVSGAPDKLGLYKGITVATENMVYIWGSYNTTGINVAPPPGTATLNDGGYLGPQVPASIVADAFFPLSKTWADGMSAYNPEGGNSATTIRRADENVPGPNEETAVRAAILAGINKSALTGDPDQDNGADSRLSGGIHNYPRFIENWLTPQRRWNFVGSYCPLFSSTQALGPWIYLNQQIYGAPQRNWAFDTSFRDVRRLPPGTPMFQYIEPTGFRQVIN